MYRKSVALLALGLVLAIAGGVHAQVIQGKVLFEYWFGGGINNLLDTLKAHPDFPDNAHDGALLDALDHPDWANLDYWGARGRAYLTAPADGDYTFWIAADDDCDLYLSTDEDPANAVMIAQLVGWCGYQDYAGTSGSRGDNYISDPVPLVAGQRYYVEMLFCDGTGGGHGSIGWTGPGIADPVPVPSDAVSIEAAWIPTFLYQAKNPEPADGAANVTAPLFKWEAGLDAVMHEVYFGTSPDLGPADFKGPMPVTLYFHVLPLVPGETYYWRIDEVRADGSKTEGEVWSFMVQPLEAHFPSPEDGATELPVATDLSWTAGQGATSHVVYMSKDQALVEARDESVKVADQAESSLMLDKLDVMSTYYWAVDEVDATGAVVPGPLWSFSTVSTYVPISDDEVSLDYDNSAEPFVSELALDAPADWTAHGMGTLTMQFIGRGAGEGDVEIDEATGTYTITGSGADIWGNSDQFHYGYLELNGDASMVARVVSNGSGSNEWAKGGVMIRQSLDAGSQHAFMPITAGGGNGASFQRRIETDGSSSNSDSGEAVAPPYWVKLDRVGNSFTGSISSDGDTWTQLGDPVEITMTDPVLIGLAVTSHQSGERRTFTFDSVSGTGDIGTTIAHCDIGIPSNAPQPLYLVAEDATGATAVVTHSDPAATNITQWWTWKVALSDLEGVDLTNMAKLTLGVGDPVNPTADGSGTVRFDDIRLVPAVGGAMEIVWVSDQYDDNEDGVPDDKPWVDLLAAQGYSVDVTMGAEMGDGYWRTLDQDKLDALNAADLIIVSRNSNSGDYDDGDEPTQWNSVETPLILMSTHIVRSSRWKFVNTTSTNNAAPMMLPMDAAHPIFAGAAVNADGLINAQDERNSSFASIADAGNGTVLAVRADTGDIWIATWDAGVEYYVGAEQTAGGPRMFFVAGTQEVTPAIGRGEVNLTLDGEKVFLNAVKMMIAADVTKPGDNVRGVPNDGDWPGAEYPALAIDDNTGTKYLHFKGETQTTGIQIERVCPPAVVTGLRLTTANDAPERDPVMYEVSGSDDINGPWTLIASGDVVDFAQEEAWPRFTANATPITFANSTAYQCYQVLFPAVRDPAAANSMQIAEVELIGLLCATSYTYDGGRLDSQWDHDNGSDQWDGSAIGEGNPGGASALVEDDVTFLRIQDTGDPRDYGMGDPGSNRKVYLTRPICGGLDGAHLEVGIRVATGAPLDDQHPDGGGGVAPWPEGGIGYHIRDNGKGMFGVCDGADIISFSLAKAGEIEGLETDALVVNNLVGAEASGDVDTSDAADAVAVNMLPIADATAWNDIVIDIAAGGAGTHVVTVSINGEAPVAVDVTAGTGEEEDYSYVTIGSSGTGGITAFDVDYLTVSN